MARIAITGGTGFVGIHTSKALTRAGHQLRLIARGTRNVPRPAGAELVRADLLSGDDDLVGALRGCDVVVHLVAIIRQRGGQTYDAVNRQGTEAVVGAARAAGVGHIVHLSAIGVDPDPAFPYLASKWAGEQVVRGGGVPFTVLRPSLLFGPGDGFFTTLTKLVRFNPVIPVAGDGRNLFQPLHITDLTRIIEICIERGPSRRVHEVGGPDHLSYDQIHDAIAAAIGVRRRKVHLPVLAVLPAAMVMDRLLPRPPVTPDQLKLLAKNNITRLDAVPAEFGFEPDGFADSAGYLQDY